MVIYLMQPNLKDKFLLGQDDINMQIPHSYMLTDKILSVTCTVTLGEMAVMF